MAKGLDIERNVIGPLERGVEAFRNAAGTDSWLFAASRGSGRTALERA